MRKLKSIIWGLGLSLAIVGCFIKGFNSVWICGMLLMVASVFIKNRLS